MRRPTGRDGMTNAASILQPTVHTYATVMKAWASCGGGGRAASKAQALLRRMLAPTSKVRPDTVVWNVVLHAWATSGDPQAGSKARELLQEMKNLGFQPDTVSYNTVVSAISHSGHIHAASQAEGMLQQMREAYEKSPASSAVPNTVSYNSVLHAWSKSSLEGAAARAEAILNFMLQHQQKSGGTAEITPDAYSFTSTLNALAKSQEPSKAIRAQAWLSRLLDMYKATRSPSLKPTQVAFNTVLNAAAFSAKAPIEEQRAALQVAVQTLKLMREEKVPPDSISYGNLLKCFANLMPAGKVRTDMALQLFEKCCQEGYVSELAWNEVKRAVPAKRLGEALNLNRPVTSLDVHDLPKAWQRRVSKNRLQRQKRVGGEMAKASSHSSRTRQEITGKEEKGTFESNMKRKAVRQLRNLSEPSYDSGRDV